MAVVKGPAMQSHIVWGVATSMLMAIENGAEMDVGYG